MQKKFANNEECAQALFQHLVSTGLFKASDSDTYIDILHDINNLRGHEWLVELHRNLDTKPFFDFLASADWYEDQFAYGRAVSPNVFLKVVLNKEYPENISLNELRDVLDSNGLDHMWDYCPEDLDEAINNLSDDMYLLGVSFYEKDGYTARIFEIDEDAYQRLDRMLVVTERGDIVLPCDVRCGDPVVGPYIRPLDEQISSSAERLSQSVAHSTSEVLKEIVKKSDPCL